MRIKSIETLVAFILSIILICWQLYFYFHPFLIPSDFSIKNTVGGAWHHLEGFRIFTEGFKQTGLYPLNPNRLEMEVYDTYRMGDRGKMFLLWFDSQFSELNWGYIRANSLFFISALLVFFLGFFLRGHKLFAVITTAIIGSSSFQLYETYANSNIFSWPISTTILLMGLNAFVFDNLLQRLKFHHLFIALLTGILLGLIKLIRAEPVIISISIVTIYLLMTNLSIKARTALSTIFIFGFLTTNIFTNYALDDLYKKTEIYVIKNGGEPYDGNKRTSHLIWHPIFCGFGDYASSLGYRWDDYVAYAYALKILRIKEPNLWPEFKENLTQKNLSDYFIVSNSRYKKKLEDREDYEQILREKVIEDITEHPRIFTTLYLYRLRNVFLYTGGIQLNIPYIINAKLNWHGLGFLFFLSLGLAIKRRDFFSVKALLFSLPLVLSAVIINSKNSYQLYSIYSLISFSVLVGYLLEYMSKLKKKL